MVIYQLHIGTYRSLHRAFLHFLDVAGKVPYFVALGINVLQPLPIDEQEANPSMGYDGADLFSPDFPYVAGAACLPGYLRDQRLFAAKGCAAAQLADITSGPAQLKVMVDLCHLYGIAVVFDVVYNHAGGFNVNGALDDASYYFDRMPASATTTTASTSPTRIAAPAAGLRAVEPGCPPVSSTMRAITSTNFTPTAFATTRSALCCDEPAAGLDVLPGSHLHSRQSQPRFFRMPSCGRESSRHPNHVRRRAAGRSGRRRLRRGAARRSARRVRGAIGAASVWRLGGRASMSAIAQRSIRPGLRPWLAGRHLRREPRPGHGRRRDPRIPALADPSDHRSWYARSRCRVATGPAADRARHSAAVHGPGVPRGQAMERQPECPNLIWWDGLDAGDAVDGRPPALHPGPDRGCAGDCRRCAATSASVPRPRRQPRARLSSLDRSRRSTTWSWSPPSLRRHGGLRRSAFPAGPLARGLQQRRLRRLGQPAVAGNGGGVSADGPPMHGFAASASS